MGISQAKCPGCQFPMQVTQMRCAYCDLTPAGEFELSSLARLSLEDQLFVVAFFRHHGSIKKMDSLFCISYPTVKNRLNAIAAMMDMNIGSRTMIRYSERNPSKPGTKAKKY